MNEYYELTRKRFQQPGIAEIYEKSRFGTLKGKFLKYREENIARDILARAGRELKVLDVPCGTGRFGAVLKQYADVLIGADISKPMLESSRKRGQYSELRRCEIENMPFPNGYVDVLACFRLLHHLPSEDRARAFAEIHRVTKRYFIFTFNTKASIAHVINKIILRKSFYSETMKTMRQELENYFTVRQTFRILPFVAGETIVFCEKKVRP